MRFEPLTPKSHNGDELASSVAWEGFFVTILRFGDWLGDGVSVRVVGRVSE